MFKRGFYLLLFGVLALVAGISLSSSSFLSDWKDERLWEQMKRDLLKAESFSVTFEPGVSLEEEEAIRVKEILLNARFKESNRRGHGPTPEGGFVIQFADGTSIRVNSWGGSTFEVAETSKPPQYGPDAQFLIESAALGTWFQENSAKWEGTLAATQLAVQRKDTPDGFRLIFAPDPDLALLQTSISPVDGTVLHLVRRGGTVGENRWIRYDLVMTKPETGEIRTIPITNTASLDLEYEIDSAVRIYGFTSEKRIIYVAAYADTKRKSLSFNVESMDPGTGEKKVLFPGFWSVDAENRDWLTPGWLTGSGEKLVLNQYKGGKVWVFDLGKRQQSSFHDHLKQHWPIYMTYPSPRGERFWYEDMDQRAYRLYNLDGDVLRSVPFEKGYVNYPIFQWSPDGQYAAYQFTRNQEGAVLLDSGEINVYAPEGVQVFDSEGNEVQRFEVEEGSPWKVEIAGWLTDHLVLHYYQVEQKEGEAQNITHSAYKLGSLKDGTVRDLKEAAALAELAAPSMVLNSPSPRSPIDLPMFVDVEQKRYWPLPEKTVLCSPLQSDKVFLLEKPIDSDVKTVYQYNQRKKELLPLKKVQNTGEVTLSPAGWIIAAGGEMVNDQYQTWIEYMND